MIIYVDWDLSPREKNQKPFKRLPGISKSQSRSSYAADDEQCGHRISVTPHTAKKHRHKTKDSGPDHTKDSADDRSTKPKP